MPSSTFSSSSSFPVWKTRTVISRGYENSEIVRCVVLKKRRLDRQMCVFQCVVPRPGSQDRPLLSFRPLGLPDCSMMQRMEGGETAYKEMCHFGKALVSSAV